MPCNCKMQFKDMEDVSKQEKTAKTKTKTINV